MIHPAPNASAANALGLTITTTPIALGVDLHLGFLPEHESVLEALRDELELTRTVDPNTNIPRFTATYGAANQNGCEPWTPMLAALNCRLEACFPVLVELCNITAFSNGSFCAPWTICNGENGAEFTLILVLGSERRLDLEDSDASFSQSLRISEGALLTISPAACVEYSYAVPPDPAASGSFLTLTYRARATSARA